MARRKKKKQPADTGAAEASREKLTRVSGTITSFKKFGSGLNVVVDGVKKAVYLSELYVSRSGFKIDDLRVDDALVVDVEEGERGLHISWIYTVNGKDSEQFAKAPRQPAPARPTLSLPEQSVPSSEVPASTEKESVLLEEGTRAIGVILSYDVNKGYGFIKVEGSGDENVVNYFFHFRDAKGVPKSKLREGNRVCFTATSSSDGKARANIYALHSEA